VDRNLALNLPRPAVLVSIEADRPGAWFPGPLGPYAAWFPAILLNRDFKRAKVPGNPMKSPFLFWRLLGGHIQKKHIFASRQPNHVKYLLSGLYNLLKYNFHSRRSPPGDPRVAHCSHFSVRIRPRFHFFSSLPESAPGAHRGVVTRHRGRIRIFLAPYAALFPAI
jgi:hypothetical protein